MSSKVLQSALLFAGTAIGAGMLALPIATGISGFFPSLIFILLWFTYSLCTMLILLECMGYLKDIDNAGFLSMSQQFSGPIGKILIRTCYTLLLYAVTTAYIIGGGQILHNALHLMQIDWPLKICCIIFSVCFSYISMQKFNIVGTINQWLMYVLIGAFLCMVASLSIYLQPSALITWSNPWALLPSASIIVLSFACHNLLPTILHNIGDDIIAIRRSIYVGMLVPLFIYLLWNMIIIGILPPTGSGSIIDITTHHTAHGGELAMLAQSLHAATGSVGVLDKLFMVFGLSAIITSYMGVVVSLKDFLIQALKIHQYPSYAPLSMLLIFIPTIFFAVCYPHGFSIVLHGAGLIVAYIFGLAPILWTYRARYHLKLPSRYPSHLPLWSLYLLGLLSCGLILYQCYTLYRPGAEPIVETSKFEV